MYLAPLHIPACGGGPRGEPLYRVARAYFKGASAGFTKKNCLWRAQSGSAKPEMQALESVACATALALPPPACRAPPPPRDRCIADHLWNGAACSNHAAAELECWGGRCSQDRVRGGWEL